MEIINAKFKSVKAMDQPSGGEFEIEEAGGGLAGAKGSKRSRGTKGYGSATGLKDAKDAKGVKGASVDEGDENTPGRGYVLVGPGRWGSSDPWLGIPVTWTQISEARLIVESGLENYRIDPSQGTHFFQNLTSFRVGYMTINPFISEGFYDTAYLDSLDAVYEDEHVRHVRFDRPLEILIDGRTHRGAVRKPLA
jgi:hypothetical protein